MGISFKVSKTGRRFRPKPPLSNAVVLRANDEDLNDAPIASSKQKTDAIELKLGDDRENRGISKVGENEVSFTLKLFPDGYAIGKPVEDESGNQTSIDVPKLLRPYDRASEALFSAIESGRFPGDIRDDIPCKYIDGTLVCEVRDYRKCFAEGVNVASGKISATINRVSLKMTLENIVKDIPSISENGWTYGDLMEVESRILKATQPQLCLDPSPQLDKLSEDPVQNKLNLEPHSIRRKRLRQISEANNHGKKASLGRVPESSRLGDTVTLVQQPAYENTNSQNNVPSAMLQLRSNSFGSDGSLLPSPMASHQPKYSGGGSPRMMKDQRTGALLNASVGSPGGQGMMIPSADNTTASLHGKRENQDGKPSLLTNKKARLTHTGAKGNIQHLSSQMDTFHGSELHWKNTLTQQQSIGREMQYTDNGMHKFPQQVFEGVQNQVGGPDGRVTMGETELAYIDSQQSQLQQEMPHQMMRSGFPQAPWNNLGQSLDNNSRKEDPFQKRKLVQSPRVSHGGLPQSPLSTRSGEFSSGSMGHQFGAAVTSRLVLHKDKTAVTSVGVGGTPSFTTSANDSVQRQHHAQTAAKRRSNSLPKTPAINGVGYPASVGNMSIPINASCPSVGSQALGDQTTERFSKIESVAMRYQLNCKNGKDDEYPMSNSSTYSTQPLMSHLSSDSNNENLKDTTCQMPLSKSLVGGSMDVCKTRILNFIRTERIVRGNTFQVVPNSRTTMIMSEKPDDGAVVIHIGEIESAEYLVAENYLPTLPNTHMADLLALQYAKLMMREGYYMEDRVQQEPVRMNPNSGTQPSTPRISPTSAEPEMQQFLEGVLLQQSSDAAKPSNSGNSTSLQNLQGPRMLPPGNTQAIQMSQGLLPGISVSSRPQQPGQPPPKQQQPQQPQQHPQSQRMLSTNPMQKPNHVAQNANMQLGSQTTNKTTAAEQLPPKQQQPRQPQQHPRSQRMLSTNPNHVAQNANMQLGPQTTNKTTAPEQLPPKQQKPQQPQQHSQSQRMLSTNPNNVAQNANMQLGPQTTNKTTAPKKLPPKKQQPQPQQPQQHPQSQRMLSTNPMQNPNNVAQNANMQLGPQTTNKTTAPGKLPPKKQHQQPQQHPQQHPQSQRMLSTNPMQNPNNVAKNANMQLGPQMTNKTTAPQCQLTQQQQPSQLLKPQQQSTVQRKMMPGLGNVSIGDISSNMAGPGDGGLGNATGIGGARGVSGSGISAPMGSVPNIGNMNQNPMNLTSAASLPNTTRSGALTPQQAAYMKKTMGKQNRANMLGNPQSSIGGIPGAKQMHPGSGVSTNRANTGQMKRATRPKVPGMNHYKNQQPQQQLQQQQQQHQLQQPQQQQQQQQQQQKQQQLQQHPQPQQQETTSPLQPVVLPPHVGSPPSVGIPHQMNKQQPQKMSQRTPMSPQLSSAAIHPMGAGNSEACPIVIS